MMMMPFTPPRLGEQQWKDLRQLPPADVCRRAGVSYDDRGWYAVPFMDREYRIDLNEEIVSGVTDDELTMDIEFVLLLLVYLLCARAEPLSGKWVNERDLKDGNLFFRGPHALPTKGLLDRFGANPQAFVTSGQLCGGTEGHTYGDVALQFQALPRIPVICVLWAADEEFPARVSFLFDPSITAQLPLDVVLALIRCVCKRIVATDRARTG